jgi:hypothetical protein
VGNRLEIIFDGLDLGIFKGAIRYQFFPGSRLIEQSAVVSTNEPDTAYIYTAGLRATVDADRRAGGNMDSKVTFFDTTGGLVFLPPQRAFMLPMRTFGQASTAPLILG